MQSDTLHPKAFFKDFFRRDLPLPNAGYCFVAMPFKNKFVGVWSAIQETLESRELGFHCYRADEDQRGGLVMGKVLQELKDAEVVIADVTGGNANVFYELGIAHTVKDAKSVVLISQDKPPFDVGPYHYCQYTVDDLQLLRRKLKEAVKKATPARKKITRRVGQLYESKASALGYDNVWYRFSIRVVKVGEAAAELHLEVWPDDRPKQRKCIDHSLRIWGKVTIPRIRYAVKLHAVRSDKAEFCICDPNPPET
jgi:hypothetical protein